MHHAVSDLVVACTFYEIELVLKVVVLNDR